MTLDSLALLGATVRSGDGWIGAWSPGIGDPTWIGWTITVLYFVSAGLCLRHARRCPRIVREKKIWIGLGLFLLALGFNKQLDIQTAFTEIGRLAARSQGWYGQRRAVQLVFVVLVLVIGIATAKRLLDLARGTLKSMRMAVLGAVCLTVFIVIRATSFHHLDLVLGLRVSGIALHTLLEATGIVLIGIAAIRARPLPQKK